MMRRGFLLGIMGLAAVAVCARNVSVHARNGSAADVFAEIMGQTGKNFVYPGGLLDSLTVSVSADDEPLETVLERMFADTGIGFRIKGDNVMLFRQHTVTRTSPRGLTYDGFVPESDIEQLDEVVVVSTRNNFLAAQSPEIGSDNVSSAMISSTPVIFGESDVIKTLQLQPGVSAGLEAMAGMYVHGGNADENMYMLDNVPLYQVNHFGGLFSAFNTEAIRSVDFYKTTFPAKYDGRLSSFMDVHTRDGSTGGHHGSFRLGLTSGSFSIEGPMSSRTSYSASLRRSWYELLSVPVLALANHGNDEKTSFRYAFTDANVKLTHRFSERSKVYITAYYGEDILNGGWRELWETESSDDKAKLRWGNVVVSAGWNYVLTPELFVEFTAAYTGYFSRMSHCLTESDSRTGTTSSSRLNADNNINDWIAKANFEWRPGSAHKVGFGAGYTHHSFLPSRSTRSIVSGENTVHRADSVYAAGANEFNIYAGDDWTISRCWRANAGAHLSLFNKGGKTHAGLSPRASVRYVPADGWALKAAYARAYQYVHQLSQSYLSLPTDQWVPIAPGFRPQSSDKISVGVYRLLGGMFSVSAEGYFKWMHNLIDYRDEYYLIPLKYRWDAALTTGRGTARGLDFKVSRETGAVTGHVAYSLLWADRTFADKNGGQTYPARFDNRHKINLSLCWNLDGRWRISASWTGMSGNRFTLPTQVWEGPDMRPFEVEVPLKPSLNNHRLPFYHRLDLGVTRHTRRGYWTLSLYNAYCNMNVVAVRRGSSHGKPVFQYLHMIPIIPSFSYTWIF